MLYYARRALAVLSLPEWTQLTGKQRKDVGREHGEVFEGVPAAQIVDLCKLAIAAEQEQSTAGDSCWGTLGAPQLQQGRRNDRRFSSRKRVRGRRGLHQARVLRSLLKRVFIRTSSAFAQKKANISQRDRAKCKRR